MRISPEAFFKNNRQGSVQSASPASSSAGRPPGPAHSSPYYNTFTTAAPQGSIGVYGQKTTTPSYSSPVPRPTHDPARTQYTSMSPSPVPNGSQQSPHGYNNAWNAQQQPPSTPLHPAIRPQYGAWVNQPQQPQPHNQATPPHHQQAQQQQQTPQQPTASQPAASHSQSAEKKAEAAPKPAAPKVQYKVHLNQPLPSQLQTNQITDPRKANPCPATRQVPRSYGQNGTDSYQGQPAVQRSTLAGQVIPDFCFGKLNPYAAGGRHTKFFGSSQLPFSAIDSLKEDRCARLADTRAPAANSSTGAAPADAIHKPILCQSSITTGLPASNAGTYGSAKPAAVSICGTAPYRTPLSEPGGDSGADCHTASHEPSYPYNSSPANAFSGTTASTRSSLSCWAAGTAGTQWNDASTAVFPTLRAGAPGPISSASAPVRSSVPAAKYVP